MAKQPAPNQKKMAIVLSAVLVAITLLTGVLAPAQRSEAISRPAWHVIAVLHFRNPAGKIGVKVLPRTVQKVIMYHSRVSAVPGIDHIELYLHNDPYFNRYPVSSALHYHEVLSDEIMKHLDGARRLAINGSMLVYAR